MSEIGPVNDNYIDSIIKANAVSNPNVTRTLGVGLRQLVKLLRDRSEQEITNSATQLGLEAAARAAGDNSIQNQINSIVPLTSGNIANTLGYVPANDALVIHSSVIGASNGVVPLDANAKISAAYLPSYVDDVLEFANLASLPATGESSKIYVTLDNNFEYRWSGSVYIRLVASPGTTDALTEGVTNLYYTNARVAAFGDTRYLALTGGSLSGNLNGTTANFTGNIDGSIIAARGSLGGLYIEDRNTPSHLWTMASEGDMINLRATGLGNVYTADYTTQVLSFVKSPIVPIATLSGQAVNFGQLSTYLPRTAGVGFPLTGELRINSTTAAIVLTNTASANKQWDISTNGSDFRLNETGIATRLGFVPGGFVGVGYTADPTSGNVLGVNGNAYISGGVVATGGSGGNTIRMAGASPYISWYNAANTTRWGYIQHNGSALTIFNDIGGVNIGNPLTVNGTATFTGKVIIGQSGLAYGNLSIVGLQNNPIETNASSTGIAGVFATIYNTSEAINSVAGIRLVTRNSAARVWDIYNESKGSGIGDLVFSGAASGTTRGESLRIAQNGQVSIAGDVEITGSIKGVILKSPNGARWRVTIDNTGTLIRTSI
jgi:hypothetical protein